MRVMRTVLLCTTLVVSPTLVQADPVSAFVAGFTASGAAGVSATVAGTIGGLTGAAFAIGSFFGQTLLGSLLLNVGLAYLMRPEVEAPEIERAQVNVRLPDAPRYQLGGPVKIGGAGGIFAEYDGEGSFWYIVVHGDAEMLGEPQYFLDGIPIEISDGSDGFPVGSVTTDIFCFNGDKEVYTGGSDKRESTYVFPVTPTAGQVSGALPSQFTSAFPDLPEDFFLAGVCYTIVKVRDVSTEAKPVVWRWRQGPIGIGEPGVTVYANFSRVPDVRVEGVDPADPSTWVAGDGNPAILWAWWRLNQFGRARSAGDINWTKVAEAADICDLTVTDRSGDPVTLYRCGVAIPDSMTRQEGEAEILKSMDAFVAYDDEGRAYPVPGWYEAPTLTFTAERDLFTVATQSVDDGEQPMDGVVVRYISPDHDYTKQPCAPWKNPDFYDESREPNYLFVDILGCQNHNQAVRLAKAIGGREQALRKAALGATIKGILATRERAIQLEYDAVFTGVHEIATPVTQQADGMACAFAVVPLAEDRWTLGEGEEGAPPVPTPTLNIDNSLTPPQNVVLTSESVATDNGASVRIAATFDAPARGGDVFRFRYAPAGTIEYEYFSVDMDRLYGNSALVSDGATFDVQWKTVNGDRGTDWSDVEQITVTANATPPDDLSSASATGDVGEAVLAWTTANDPNQHAVQVRRGTTATFAAATLISTVITPANTEGGATDAGLSADTYYYWFTPINGSGVPGNDDGPFAATVT
ncbi:hypothetical protein CEW88_15615 [Alloyangia pacifica]|uniref:Tip attachment protein J domain-containing protein n=1 Tax=Alloyangia pacifica TaxID=311180 RepID=A0A2U8HK40_9RHOB|nr:hypothetical protein [Alloyangia pacifica]AWI85175.1 hypothetical protein CEW88_15615 [Alloyangia pacifica]